MPRVVVLGTGTGVGKTYVTAALARAVAMILPGAPVLAVKPVETGVIRRQSGVPPGGSDAEQLERASSRASPPRPHPLYALHKPVSAHLAARQESLQISIPAIVRWINSTTLRGATSGVATPWTLIETAGGALSPLTARITNADLACRLDPAIWVLVAPDSLGVFHDLHATLLALAAIARVPDYVVLSEARPPDAATGRNAGEFRRLGLPRPIAVVGRGKDPHLALAPLVRAIRRRRTSD